jgi:methyl-accepting chemotaxis protein
MRMPEPHSSDDTGFAERRRHNSNSLSKLVAGLGYQIVDIAGFIEEVRGTAGVQIETLEEAKQSLRDLSTSSDAVVQSSAKVAASSHTAMTAVDNSIETVRLVSSKSQSVSGWVMGFEDRLNTVDDSLKTVRKANTDISKIAKQIDMLAINATIEAVRAGDSGRGFAVVASAIKELSHSTTKAARDVAERVEDLATTMQALRNEAKEISLDANEVIEQSSATDAALVEIGDSIRTTAADSDEISEQAASVEKASRQFVPAFVKMSNLAQQTADGVALASDRTNGIIQTSETIVQQTAALGGVSADTPFISFVQHAADQIKERWEAEIARGRIALEDLFDQNYRPIPNTDPQQFVTRFTDFTDATLPDIQEPALEFDPKVVFCAAVDTNGYLSTHNHKFAHPQSEDPVWNASHCRNRRIFDDRVGLKSGQNTEAFLLQVYRRDMGGGAFKMMKDLSSPIYINGRHLGGLRMAYTFD